MKIRFIVAAIVMVWVLSSCASISFPDKNSGLSVNLETKSYDILGDVVIEGTTISVLGIYTVGGATFYDLVLKAKNLYKADDVINISLDKRASMFLGVYYSYTYVLRGIAIKYN